MPTSGDPLRDIASALKRMGHRRPEVAHLTEGLENMIDELRRENSDLRKQCKEQARLLGELQRDVARKRTARYEYIEQISALLFAAHLVRPSKLTGRECSAKAIADAVAHAAQLDQYFERPPQ